MSKKNVVKHTIQELLDDHPIAKLILPLEEQRESLEAVDENDAGENNRYNLLSDALDEMSDGVADEEGHNICTWSSFTVCGPFWWETLDLKKIQKRVDKVLKEYKLDPNKPLPVKSDSGEEDE